MDERAHHPQPESRDSCSTFTIVLLSLGSLSIYLLTLIPLAFGACGRDRDGICSGSLAMYLLLPAFLTSLVSALVTLAMWRWLSWRTRSVGMGVPLIMAGAFGLVLLFWILVRR